MHLVRPFHDTDQITAHTDQITGFRILVIPGAIFQVRAFKFGTVGALNRLININHDKISDAIKNSAVL